MAVMRILTEELFGLFCLLWAQVPKLTHCGAHSQALAVDFYATNGVIHLIDRVLFPPPKFKKEIPKKRPNKSSQKDNRSNLSAGEVRTILKTIPQRSTQG